MKRVVVERLHSLLQKRESMIKELAEWRDNEHISFSYPTRNGSSRFWNITAEDKAKISRLMVASLQAKIDDIDIEVEET